MNVIIAGDFAPKARLAKQVEARNFVDIFPNNLVDVIKSADYSLVNFKSPIIDDNFKPIQKCGPNLGCTSDAVDAIKYVGFTAVTMANNHIFDYGAEGLNKSIDCCRKVGLEVVGVGSNLFDAEKILYVRKGDKKLAIINCCEHEFSTATPTSSGANPLNPIRQYYCIQEARNNADYVLIIVHGGTEHYHLPSPRMKETYRFFVDAGADVVVNHHQHCYSGYENYRGGVIFYGLGNFLFDWEGKRNCLWNYGYFVKLDFSDKISFELYPYIQCNDEASISLISNDEAINIYADIEKLNNIIAQDSLLLSEYNNYIKKECKWVNILFEPWQRRITSALYLRNLLPSMLPKSRRLLLINYLNCESHIDIVRRVLEYHK